MMDVSQFDPLAKTSADPMLNTTPFHVLAKPTGPKCNLQCEYCFYKEKEDNVYAEQNQANTLNMDEALLEEYVIEYIQSQQSLTSDVIHFLWQGGEPTMRGIAYYRKAVQLQQAYCPEGKTISNHFQTNGILINEQWATFFSEHHFLIGISIDGPQFVHDMYRKTLKGAGSFNKVIKGLDWLKQYRVSFNTMTVVGKHNQHLGQEVYLALKALGAKNMQFIPLVERFDEDAALSSPPAITQPQEHHVTQWSVSQQGYGLFMNAVFDQWIEQDVGDISIQLFEVQLDIWLGQPSSLCIYTKNCGGGVVMEHNGDVYSCDHFVYPEYKLGNINEQTLQSMALSQQQAQFGRDKFEKLPQKCRDCDYQKACYGGCPKHRFIETAVEQPTGNAGVDGLNYLCQSYLSFFDHAGPWIHRMAQLIRSGKSKSLIMQHPEIKARKRSRIEDKAATGKISRNSVCPCQSGKKYKRCCG